MSSAIGTSSQKRRPAGAGDRRGARARFMFIKANPAWPLTILAWPLGAGPRGDHAWRGRASSARACGGATQWARLRAIRACSHGIDGAPHDGRARLHAVHERGRHLAGCRVGAMPRRRTCCGGDVTDGPPRQESSHSRAALDANQTPAMAEDRLHPAAGPVPSLLRQCLPQRSRVEPGCEKLAAMTGEGLAGRKRPNVAPLAKLRGHRQPRLVPWPNGMSAL